MNRAMGEGGRWGLHLGKTGKNRINTGDFQFVCRAAAQFLRHQPVDRLHTIDRAVLTKSQFQLTIKIGVLKP
jgi:hypothetical protein